MSHHPRPPGRRVLRAVLVVVVVLALSAFAVHRSRSSDRSGHPAPGPTPGPSTGSPSGSPSDSPSDSPSGSSTGAPGAGTAGRATFTVDPALRPARAEVVAPDGRRPVAVLRSEAGLDTMFVADELIVRFDRPDQLTGLVRRQRGRVVRQLAVPAALGGGQFALVHVDPPRTGTADLPADLAALGAMGTGRYRVSGEPALRLLAAAAAEQRHGTADVDLNVIGGPSGAAEDIVGRSVRDAAPTPAGWPGSAARVPYLRKDGVQRIGVTEAWRRLVLAGRISGEPTPLVRVAVLDAGFANSPDLPRHALFNAVYDATGRTRPNTWGCSTGPGCEWHGTQVSHTLAAVPGNGRGVAGPAGPVADLTLLQSPTDVPTAFSYLMGLLTVLVRGPRIINISADITLDAILYPLANALGRITGALRAAGVLTFAAAGNQGRDVDSTQCLAGFCWERQMWLPCELAGVVCVAGLGYDQDRRAGGSNFGAADGGRDGRGVDIYGPYTVWVPTADLTGVEMANGNSVASPFVAGVAALIWAADPRLRADEVERILLETAHRGGPDSGVTRWVNADGAVSRVLGPVCEPPAVHITRPDGAPDVLADTPAVLTAHASDGGRPLPDAAYRWSLDGREIATGARLTHRLPRPGVYRLTVTAKGCAAVPSRASATVTVRPTPPPPAPGQLVLRSPAEGSSWTPTGQEPDGRWYTELQLTAAARYGDGSAVPDARIRWTSDVGGALGTGASVRVRIHSGRCTSVTHTVTATVLDDAGRVVASATRRVTALSAPC